MAHKVTQRDRERAYQVLMIALMQARLPWQQRMKRMREIQEACFG
jgi:hypothetical protein